MRKSCWTLLVAFALAGDAMGDEVRTESLEAFTAELRDLDQLADLTTLQKVARRRKLAASRLVHREGRISDVKPCVRDGRELVCVEVEDLRESGERISFLLPSEVASAVMDWSRGDGV